MLDFTDRSRVFPEYIGCSGSVVFVMGGSGGTGCFFAGIVDGEVEGLEVVYHYF